MTGWRGCVSGLDRGRSRPGERSSNVKPFVAENRRRRYNREPIKPLLIRERVRRDGDGGGGNVVAVVIKGE